MKRTRNNKEGFLLLEVLLTCALFVAIVPALGNLMFSTQSFLIWSEQKIKDLAQADEKLESGFTTTTLIDNFTKKLEVRVGLATLSTLVTDTSESEGQSSCRPNQDIDLWKNLKVLSLDVSSLGILMEPTDVDVVGRYFYISSNTANTNSPDIFIFDISDIDHVKLLSKIDTGPGIEAIHVAGNFVYAANTSINAQLQIIDISEKNNPKLQTSYKLPGNYASSTPVGTSVFYKNKKVFLGIDKSDIDEFYYIDVASNPRVIDSEEIGHGVNDIFAFKNKVYVASPHKDELKVFSISESENLSPAYSYNDPGTTGNGKRVWLFLDQLLVGKTKTFDREELLVLEGESPPTVTKRYSFAASIHGVIRYGTLLFLLINKTEDGFVIFDQLGQRVNKDEVNFSSLPLNFDCDKDLFVIVSEKSSKITFITYL